MYIKLLDTCQCVNVQINWNKDELKSYSYSMCRNCKLFNAVEHGRMSQSSLQELTYYNEAKGWKKNLVRSFIKP